MKILAVEFSSERRSAALLDEAELLGHAAETGGRRVIGLVEDALRQAGCEREDMEAIAVGLGPRLLYWHSWRDCFCPRLAIGPGHEDHRHQQCRMPGRAGGNGKNLGPVNIVIDAQRNEFYLARYEIGSGPLRQIEPLRLAALSEIQKRDAAGEKIIGPDINSWFPRAINLYPAAAVLGRLADDRADFISGDKLEPIYLRETAFKKAPPLRILP